MSFTINLETENQEIIEAIEDDGLLSSFLIKSNIGNKDYTALSQIDLFGDTVFNRIQIGRLIEELEYTKNSINESSLKAMIDKIIEMSQLA